MTSLAWRGVTLGMKPLCLSSAVSLIKTHNGTYLPCIAKHRRAAGTNVRLQINSERFTKEVRSGLSIVPEFASHFTFRPLREALNDFRRCFL